MVRPWAGINFFEPRDGQGRGPNAHAADATVRITGSKSVGMVPGSAAERYMEKGGRYVHIGYPHESVAVNGGNGYGYCEVLP